MHLEESPFTNRWTRAFWPAVARSLRKQVLFGAKRDPTAAQPNLQNRTPSNLQAVRELTTILD